VHTGKTPARSGGSGSKDGKGGGGKDSKGGGGKAAKKKPERNVIHLSTTLVSLSSKGSSSSFQPRNDVNAPQQEEVKSSPTWCQSSPMQLLLFLSDQMFHMLERGNQEWQRALTN
jgi:hypothetical protein